MFLVGPMGKPGSGYFSFFMALSLDVFLYYFLVFQALVIVLCIFGYVTKENKLKSVCYNQWILLQILLVEVTNESVFRVSSPRRIVWSVWMISSLIFSFLISGFLVSKMSVSEKDKFIESIEDFLIYTKVWPVVKAGQVDVDIIKNTRGPAFEEVQRRLISKDNPLGILKSKAIFNKPTVLSMIEEGQAAFGSNLLNFKLLLDKRYELLGKNSCHFQLTDAYAYTVNALGFKKGFDQSFVNQVSARLQRIVSVGLSYYIYPPPLNHYKRCLQRSQSNEDYAVLTLRDFAGPLIIFFVGMLASIIVVLVEIAVSKTYSTLRSIYYSKRRSNITIKKSPWIRVQKSVLIEENDPSFIVSLRFNHNENKTIATRHESK